MRLGVSLSPSLLRGEPDTAGDRRYLDHFGSARKLLRHLREQGIASVELRYVRRQQQPDCEPVFRLIWDEGLQVTIHTRIEGNAYGNSLADCFPALRFAFTHYERFQRQLMLTLHAYNDPGGVRSVASLSAATALQLRQWLGQIDREGLNLFFAVELTRRKRAIQSDPGASIDALVQLVRDVNHSRCGICWDMGHYYSNCLQEANGVTVRPDEVTAVSPGDEFVERTLHTHIHGLSAAGQTHFPLQPRESLPLEAYVDMLAASGYEGVYNLELELQRFADIPDLTGQIDATIERLQRKVVLK